MPLIIHPATLSQVSPLKFNDGISCKFEDPGSNSMEETNTPVDNVKECVEKYEQFIHSNFSGDPNKIILYSNFRIQDIKTLIDQNTDCSFLRIYNGIDDAGNHFQMFVPVLSNENGFTKQNDQTRYIVDCCHCQPNCGSGSGSGRGFQ